MKSLLVAVLLLGISGLAPVAAQSYASVVLADSPVAYYRFDAGASAPDASGNGNNGTLVNGAQPGQAGLVALGSALRLDGVDDYVQTPRTVSTNFTLELWVNTTSTSFSGGQAFEGNGLLWSDVGGGADDFVLAFLNNRASFFTGNPDVTVIGTTPINDGRWHHVVATRAQGGATQLYVDGVLQASGTTNANPLTANPNIAIGGNVLDSRYFSGAVDEVAYYTTVLSADRIRAHYQAGIAVPAVPVDGSWALALLALALAAAGALALRRPA